MWKKFKPPNRFLRKIKRWREERAWNRHRQLYVARYYAHFKYLAELLTAARAEQVYFALEPDNLRVRIYTSGAAIAYVYIRKVEDDRMNVLVRTDLTAWYLIWFQVAFLSITTPTFEPAEIILTEEARF